MLVRVTSLVVFLPIFGDRNIPSTVKILFGLSFAFVAFPIASGRGIALPPEAMASSWKTAWAIAAEITFGVMVGFVARWIFDAVQFAGHFASTSIGFSMASVLDPHTENQTMALAELQYMLVALLFLAMDGHHVYLAAILESFKLVPLGGVDLLTRGGEITQYLTHMTAEVIVLGLKLSAPVMVVCFIMNVSFGVLSRAVPNFNVMAVSFAANILVGLIIVVVSLPGFVNLVSGAFDAYTPELFRFMRLFKG